MIHLSNTQINLCTFFSSKSRLMLGWGPVCPLCKTCWCFSQWDGSGKFCFRATLRNVRCLMIFQFYGFFYSPWSSLKHQLEVTRRRLIQHCAALGQGSTSALKGTSIAAKIGLFHYYCFNMAFYGGQMSWLAAFCLGSFYPAIIFWCEIHFTAYGSTGYCCNASASVWIGGQCTELLPSPGLRRSREASCSEDVIELAQD